MNCSTDTYEKHKVGEEENKRRRTKTRDKVEINIFSLISMKINKYGKETI